MPKVAEISSFEKTGNNLAAVSKDEKRSKKEKKIKKERKEKEAKKEQKLSNGNIASETKPSGADTPLSGLNNKMKHTSNDGQSQNLKGYPTSAIMGREKLSESGVKPTDNRVADSFSEYQNASNSILGTYCVEKTCSDLWNTDQGRIFEKVANFMQICSLVS